MYGDKELPAGDEFQEFPLRVSPEKSEPLALALKDGWLSRGYNCTNDIYSGVVDGLFHIIRTAFKGVRFPSAAFVEGRSNITIKTETRATRLIVQDGAAVGVEIDGPNGKELYQATYEIIVSCGVFETPKLLILSGIRPKDGLASHRVECQVDSPQVGKNLQEHPIVPHAFHVKGGFGMDESI